MPTPLAFKGDKKPSKSKKRKAPSDLADGLAKDEPPPSIAVEDDDSWVSAEAPTDLAGPIIVVLPSEPPACIASDANGTVFALPIENMVDENPDTAEPHDVRQVWVATRIAGTGEAVVSLRGGHGK